MRRLLTIAIMVATLIAAAPASEPAVKAPTEAQLRMASTLSMRPNDAAEISDMFFAAGVGVFRVVKDRDFGDVADNHHHAHKRRDVQRGSS